MRCPSVSESVVRVDQNVSEKKLMLFRSPLVPFRRSSQKIIFPLLFFYFRDGFRQNGGTAPSVDVPNFRALFFFSTNAKDSPIRRV